MQRKQKRRKRKKESGKLAIRLDHPRRRIEVKVCMIGGLQCLVVYITFYYNRISGLAAVDGRNRTFPFLWPLAYTTEM